MKTGIIKNNYNFWSFFEKILFFITLFYPFFYDHFMEKLQAFQKWLPVTLFKEKSYSFFVFCSSTTHDIYSSFITIYSDPNFMKLGYIADFKKIILFHSWVWYVALLEKISVICFRIPILVHFFLFSTRRLKPLLSLNYTCKCSGLFFSYFSKFFYSF